MIQQIAAAALLFAQAAPQAASPAPEAQCITHQEAADVAISLLPFVLDAVAQRCRQTLPPTAFLNTGASAWTSRLRQDGTARQESAMRGIAKMGGAAPPSGEVGQAAFVLVAQMMTGSLTTQIGTEQCPQIDTIARSLEPLPTENIADLIVAGLDLGMSARPDTGEAHSADADADHDEHESSGPPICRS